MTYAHPERPDGGAWFFLPHVVESHLPFELGVNLHVRAMNGHQVRVAQYWNDARAHVFWADMRARSYAWFDRWLKGTPG